ncbi:MAG TPA: hypothetical protein ENG03_09840, partial [Thioploca sp.]|nr:hypothetical protein [Thioploca sp.]
CFAPYLVGDTNYSAVPINIDHNGLILGREQDVLNGAFDGQDLSGQIDDIRIYNRALTDS